MDSSLSIAVIGSGYVGLVAAACFAELGHQVVCVDSDKQRIAALALLQVPIAEPHLAEVLLRARLNIRFTTDLHMAVRQSSIVFIAVGTPQTSSGGADLSFVDAVAGQIAQAIEKYTLIVTKSTVPVYTCDWIRRVIERHHVAPDQFEVAANPEFLREGQAVTDFLYPERILLGTRSASAAALLQQVYQPLLSGEYARRASAIASLKGARLRPELLLTSPETAEIIKHACNAFLATRVSFINMVANMCEQAGANVEQVAYGMGLDERIGSRYLEAGIGYGGSCLPKDIAAFRCVAAQLGVNHTLLRDVEQINAEQIQRYVDKVRSALWTLRGKRLAALGLAFKGGTDDIRASPALEVLHHLLAEGCEIAAYDPAAAAHAASTVLAGSRMRYADSVWDAAQDAEAVLILNDWPEFASLDLNRLYNVLRYPIVIDGRNLYDPQKMAAHGFTYLSMGRPTAFGNRN